jgi:K+/H+ antiporter YhaU regulatory subunit KhtT
MEEIYLTEDSKLVGRTLDECGFGRELGVIIVAIKQASGDMRFNPTFRSAIKAGDTLIALGERAKLRILEQMAKAGKK